MVLGGDGCGWTVADGARPRGAGGSGGSRSVGRSGADSARTTQDGHCVGSGSGSTGTVTGRSSSLKRAQSHLSTDGASSGLHVRFSDTFSASKSEEDLDKLLEGLDKLTEELPDLVRGRQSAQQATNGGICAAQNVNIAAPTRPRQPASAAAAVNVNSGEATVKIPVLVSADEERGRRRERERRQQPVGAERPLEHSNAHYFQQQHQATSPSPRTPDRVDSSAVFPSVKQTRHLLMSRENYNPDGADYYDGGSSSTYGRIGQPYHTMHDSKPFSYIRTNGTGSRPASRASSREAGLESPGLIRKILGGGPAAGAAHSPENGGGGLDFGRREASPPRSLSAPSPRPVPIIVSHEDSFSSRMQRPVTNLDVRSDEEASLSWLERQQKKLRERRDVDRRRNTKLHHHNPEMEMMRELKTSLHQARTEMMSTTTDGYASDLNSMLYSEASTRESSPGKITTTGTVHRPPPPTTTMPQQTYNVPLKVETAPLSTTQSHDARQRNFTQQDSFTSASSSFVLQREKSPSPFQGHYQSSPGDPYSTRSQSMFRQRQPTQPQYHSEPNPFRASLSRQKSDSSYDRHGFSSTASRRLRYDSESEAETRLLRHPSNSSLEWDASQGGFYSQPGSRPITPAFPSSLSAGRLLSRGLLTQRSASPAGSLYQSGDATSRRASISSEPAEVAPHNVKLVKDYTKFWYKPHISREEAIATLRHAPPGSFVVRDSNSFPGAFGLALKVATPVGGSAAHNGGGGDANNNSNELIRHFLIEPTSKGVKLKGYSNEPVFASLSALVYQHTITPLALPARLVLPQSDLGSDSRSRDATDASMSASMKQLLTLGAACNVMYLFTIDTDTLTGPSAIKKCVDQLFVTRQKLAVMEPVLVHFKVSSQGITLTDFGRRLFFRKHYNTNTVSYCGLDPENRSWTSREKELSVSAGIFGFVAKKPTSRTHNQCHVFAEHDPEQPAKAIVNFVNKVMLSGKGYRADVV